MVDTPTAKGKNASSEPPPHESDNLAGRIAELEQRLAELEQQRGVNV
jgi:hypothetical protein